MFKRFLIVILSAACVMALASCGTSVSAETAETAPETAAAEPVAAERAEWSLNDIATLSEVVSGITDREFAAGEGAAYKIHEDLTYDRGIVYTVLLNTASVRFDTPGTYDMTYWVYFDAAALKAWADGNGVSLDIPDAGRLAVWVSATVTVTEAEDEDAEDAEDAEDDAAGDAEDTASGSSNKTAGSASGSLKGTASGPSSCSHVWEEAYDADRDVDFLVCSRCGATKAVSGSSGSSTGASSGSSKSGGSGSSSKSASSGSSKSGSSTSVCDHDWVDEGHYESVLVQAAYDSKEKVGSHYVCNNCGFATTNSEEIGGHTIKEGCGYHAEYIYETVHHDAVYKTQWVSSYKCSKCGATK